ncbi:DUF6314 family protein, partial [Jatrophihabitans endophyticus]|uniref:DUF6314 family protein n=1 Tax=Jatrophihabitans endophyticus TaxID=1206085 RepID=UPI0019E054A5
MGAAAPTELLGCWTLERRVHDRRLERFGRVRGTVEFEPDGDSVRWTEHGTFAWDGSTFDVTRELRIDPGADGWTVRF